MTGTGLEAGLSVEAGQQAAASFPYQPVDVRGLPVLVLLYRMHVHALLLLYIVRRGLYVWQLFVVSMQLSYYPPHLIRRPGPPTRV
jgi:hypothetical protein